MNETILPIFKRCVEAIREGVLIKKVSTSDKEYHFQNWFMARLEEIKITFIHFNYDTPPILISEWLEYQKGMN